MAAIHSTPLQVRGLGKQKTAALTARAKRLGMTPQRYLKHLVEQDLAISERAKTSTFEELLGTGREVDETEIDSLVEGAKVARHRERSQ
jgi:hypothetical protein